MKNREKKYYVNLKGHLHSRQGEVRGGGAEGVQGRWAVTRRGSRIGPLKGDGSRMSCRDKQVFSRDCQLETDGDCRESVVVLG